MTDAEQAVEQFKAWIDAGRPTCPGCGTVWESLPDGHSAGISLTSGEWTCQQVPGISVEEYLAASRDGVSPKAVPLLEQAILDLAPGPVELAAGNHWTPHFEDGFCLCPCDGCVTGEECLCICSDCVCEGPEDHAAFVT